MKQTINFSDFYDAFQAIRPDNFSYDGLRALYNWLEDYADDTGEDYELDVIALCCDFCEYSCPIEAASEYFDFEGMTYNDDGSESETLDEVLYKAMEYLSERTSVIDFDSGIIIQNF